MSVHERHAFRSQFGSDPHNPTEIIITLSASFDGAGCPGFFVFNVNVSPLEDVFLEYLSPYTKRWVKVTLDENNNFYVSKPFGGILQPDGFYRVQSQEVTLTIRASARNGRRGQPQYFDLTYNTGTTLGNVIEGILGVGLERTTGTPDDTYDVTMRPKGVNVTAKHNFDASSYNVLCRLDMWTSPPPWSTGNTRAPLTPPDFSATDVMTAGGTDYTAAIDLPTFAGDTYIRPSFEFSYANTCGASASAFLPAGFLYWLITRGLKDHVSTTLTSPSDLASNNTAISVDDTTGFVAGDIINLGSELCSIDSVDSATELTVTRSLDDTPGINHKVGTPVTRALRSNAPRQHHYIQRMVP